MLGSAKPVSARRKWAALVAATVVMAISVWLILYGVVVGAVESRGIPAPSFALGLALVPFAFATLAYGSGHPAAGGAVVVALLLAVGVGLPLAALAQDVVTGVAAGYGAGAVAALRREYYQSRQARIIAVIISTTYVFATLHIDTAAGVTAASLLPFVAVGVADLASEWRRAQKDRQRSAKSD
jgi:hypothetical protein